MTLPRMYGEAIIGRHAVSEDVIEDGDEEEGSAGITLENVIKNSVRPLNLCTPDF